MGKLSTAVTTAIALFPAAEVLAEATSIDVRKTNGCGCCLAWMEHLKENGFAPTGQDMFGGGLIRFKFDNAVSQRMVSCHTALVDSYVIEGHVPASDIRRLPEERPEAVDLAVPKMPLDSPGMDFGQRREAYDIFLISDAASTEVFASYKGN